MVPDDLGGERVGFSGPLHCFGSVSQLKGTASCFQLKKNTIRYLLSTNQQTSNVNNQLVKRDIPLSSWLNKKSINEGLKTLKTSIFLYWPDMQLSSGAAMESLLASVKSSK